MKPEIYRIWWALPGIALMLAAYFGWRSTRSDAPVAPAPAQAPMPAAAPIGPGELPALPAAAFSGAPSDRVPAVLEGTVPPDGLELGRDGHLVLNKSLRDVFDYYLMNGVEGDTSLRLALLRTFLRERLSPLAFSDADAALNKYVAYLEALETIPPPSLDNTHDRAVLASAWFSERRRLRQTLLGMALARAWFGEEEDRLQRQMNALQDGGDASSVSHDDPAGREQNALRDLWAMGEKGAPLASRREWVAREFGELAARRYEESERQEQAWQDQYAAYRLEADRVRQNMNQLPGEREMQLDELRATFFPTGPERMRARALDSARYQNAPAQPVIRK